MAVKAAPRVRSNAVPLRDYRPHAGPAAIAGLGAYAPETVLTNADLERMVETSDQWIQERTGIRRRHIAEPGTTPFAVATKAARRALAASGVQPEELDMIVVATSSPDGPFPSVACRVQNELGVPGACAIDLLAACTGFVYALSTAEAYVSSGRADTVLVIGAEVLSRLVDWKDRGTCVLFADGAAGATLAPLAADGAPAPTLGPAAHGGGFRAWCLGSDGRGYEQISCGDIPRGAYAAGQSDPTIGMRGPDVFKFATDIFIRQAFAVAEEAGIDIEDI